MAWSLHVHLWMNVCMAERSRVRSHHARGLHLGAVRRREDLARRRRIHGLGFLVGDALQAEGRRVVAVDVGDLGLQRWRAAVRHMATGNARWAQRFRGSAELVLVDVAVVHQQTVAVAAEGCWRGGVVVATRRAGGGEIEWPLRANFNCHWRFRMVNRASQLRSKLSWKVLHFVYTLSD